MWRKNDKYEVCLTTRVCNKKRTYSLQPTAWKAKRRVDINFNLPAENAKDKVEHEEGADDDEGDEEHPVERVPKGIVCLQWKGYTRIDSTIMLNLGQRLKKCIFRAYMGL